MLMPKRTKYRKGQRWNFSGEATRCTKVEFGEYGIIATEPCLITNRQIEAARRTIARSLKRVGKIWIRIFPDIPYTKKPLETRMGNGKGNVEYYVAMVKPGTVMFEVAGIEAKDAEKAFWLAGQKLPIKVRMINRDSM
jgi:large subunit ribosomal protein L16